ncbi:MAG: ABC transporter ATP-binding protein [Bacillota bacterium]|jgi:putative ABC transport system ATP-binding protein|nr:ABC transporter ATP-binding protein [Candidatus Fermentithermobacillaceae bacterium]
MIKIRGLTKVYSMGKVEVPALREVDMEIPKGQFVAIMGPSGSGKSTLMNILGCLDRPTSGEYYLDGEDVSKKSDNELAEIRNKCIGFIFQSYNLLSRIDATSNVELPLIYRGTSSRERRARAAKALEAVGLGHRTQHKPTEMSGGEQQRVAIARAIVGGPKVILADEPTGNLDSRSGEEIMAIFQELHEQGITIVLVTHDPDIARHSERIISLRDGKIMSDEKVEDRLDARELLAAMPEADASA